MMLTRLGAVLFALPLLAGCGGGGSTASAPTTLAISSSPASPLETTTPPETTTTPEPPPPVTVTITCDGNDFNTPGEAWPGKFESCDGTAEGLVFSATQVRALSGAYAESVGDDKLGAIGILGGICAQNSPASWTGYPSEGPSDPQAAELEAALILCPNHPAKKTITAMLQRSRTDAKLEKEGRLIWSGDVYLVGKQIKPGTYVASNGEGCYWERQNRNGGTIINGFTVNAARVQVTIRSSDYAFNSERCGVWRPAS